MYWLSSVYYTTYWWVLLCLQCFLSIRALLIFKCLMSSMLRCVEALTSNTIMELYVVCTSSVEMTKGSRKTLWHTEQKARCFYCLNCCACMTSLSIYRKHKYNIMSMYVYVRQRHSSLHSIEFHDQRLMQLYLNATISYSAGAWLCSMLVVM